jgi:hypothetical protein
MRRSYCIVYGVASYGTLVFLTFQQLRVKLALPKASGDELNSLGLVLILVYLYSWKPRSSWLAFARSLISL